MLHFKEQLAGKKWRAEPHSCNSIHHLYPRSSWRANWAQQAEPLVFGWNIFSYSGLHSWWSLFLFYPSGCVIYQGSSLISCNGKFAYQFTKKSHYVPLYPILSHCTPLCPCEPIGLSPYGWLYPHYIPIVYLFVPRLLINGILIKLW